MLSLVNPEQNDPVAIEKQNLLNKIIAAGLNSLSGYTVQTNCKERQLLDQFVAQSFDVILACWPMLDDKIKFFIFKANVVDFENYMREKGRNQNV